MRRILLSLFSAIFIASAACAQEVTKSSDSYQLFKQELIDGNRDKAAEILNKWEEQNPKDPELYCAYATFYWIKSVELIEQSEDLTDLSSNAMLPDTIAMFQNLRSKNYRIMKDKGNGMEYFNKAIGCMEKCINEYPDIVEAYYNYVEILNFKKEFKYSTKVVLRFLEQSVKNSGKWLDYTLKPVEEFHVEELLYEHINALMEAAEFELAARLVDRALEIYPDNSNLIFLKRTYFESIQQPQN